MTGHETVIVSMLTPKGVSLVQALTFKQPEGSYEADITSMEVQQCPLPDVPDLITCCSWTLCACANSAVRRKVEGSVQCSRQSFAARNAAQPVD